MLIEAIVAALAGAFSYALAAALQAHEAARATTRGVADPRLLWQLARRPLWLAGIAATCLGAALHLFALSQGPLTFVQPLGVTGLLFAIPLAAALHHHRAQLRELAAALIVIAGLAALLSALPFDIGAHVVDPSEIVGLLLAAGVVTAAGTAFAATNAGGSRSLLLAAAAGIACGTTSALARVLLRMGWHPAAIAPLVLAGAGIAIFAPLGFLLTQSAYRAGGFAVALATITVVDPLGAAVAGVLLLHEPLPGTPAQIVAAAFGSVFVIAGVTVLARSPAQAGPRTATPSSAGSADHLVRRPARSACPAPAGVNGSDHQAQTLRILIGHDTYHPDINGAAYFTYRLATGLAARGHDVHVVCPSTDGPAHVRPEDGVTVHRLRSVPLPVHPPYRACLSPWAGRGARAVLREVRPEVVHVQGHFPIGRALIRAARRQRLPLVATNHFMPDNLVHYAPFPAVAQRLLCELAWRDFAHIFALADQVTAPTPTAADLVKAKGLSARVQAISCGIDLDRFHTQRPDGRTAGLFGLPDLPTLLFVGRLDEEKHLHELVGSLPSIRRHADAQLVMVGLGSQRRRLAAMAGKLGVAKHVHFLGVLADTDMPAAYATADVFCMPGIAELQSLATLEAMASGLPVIAADAMALPHMVRPHVNGYLYRPGDVTALTAHALTLLTSPQLRRRMGRASRDIASRHADAHTFTQFEDLYVRLRSPVRAAVSAQPSRRA